MYKHTVKLIHLFAFLNRNEESCIRINMYSSWLRKKDVNFNMIILEHQTD